jgi:hypothetical protein
MYSIMGRCGRRLVKGIVTRALQKSIAVLYTVRQCFTLLFKLHPLLRPDIKQFFGTNYYFGKKENLGFKGIVSRDWGRLQMVLINRSEVCKIPLKVYF